MKKILGLVFIIGLSLLICVSCNKIFGRDLSRSEAEKILKNLNYGEVTKDLMVKREAGYWAGTFQCPGSTHQDGTQEMLAILQPIENVYNSLAAAGFIEFTKEISDPSKRPQEQYNCDSKTYIIYKVQPLEKIANYITKNINGQILQLKVIDYVFDKITGISKESETTRIVEFTVKAKPTILANYFILNQNELNTQYKSVSFKLFDDGWRIVQ